jgi:hypothetical protein
MEAQNPLSELADIHLPGAVSWWPPAPGWWILLALILAGIAWAVVLWLKRRHQKMLLQGAIDELDATWRLYLSKSAPDHKQMTDRRGQEAVKLLNGINAVLRRVALVHYPAEDIAGLTGNDWLAFLDSCDNSSHFSSKTGKVLGDALYRASYKEDPAPVYRLAKAWIHRRYLLDKTGKRPSAPTLQEAEA